MKFQKGIPTQLDKFFWHRTIFDAYLLIMVLIGIVISTIIVSGGWIYFRGIERASVVRLVDNLDPGLQSISVTNRTMPFTKDAFDKNDLAIAAARTKLGELISSDGHFVRSPPVLWSRVSEETRADSDFKYALIQRMTDIESNVIYRQGRPPTAIVNRSGFVPIVEISVPLERASQLSIDEGDLIEVSPSINRHGKFIAVITGLFDPIDEFSSFWSGHGEIILSPDSIVPDSPLPLPIFMNGDAIWDITENSQIPIGVGQWFSYFDLEVLKTSRAGIVVERTDSYQKEVEKTIRRTLVLGGPRAAFKSLQRHAFFSRIPTYLMGILLISFASYYLVMISRLLAQRRETDISILSSRGISEFQIVRMYTLEAIPLIGLPALVSPFLAIVLLSQISKFSGYNQTTGISSLPLELSWIPFAYSIGAGAIAFAMLVIPTAIRMRNNIVSQHLNVGRPTAKPWFQHYLIDVIVLTLGGLIFWELHSQETIIESNLLGEKSMNLSLLLGPLLLLISAGFVFLRIFPPVLGVINWLTQHQSPVWVSLALSNLSRNSHYYTGPILLLVLASGLGIVSASLTSTLERSSHDRIAYEIVGDLRLQKIRFAGGSASETLNKIKHIPGVTEAAIGLKVPGIAGTTGLGQQFKMFAVQPDEFGKISWFRGDFGSTNINNILNLITTQDQPPVVTLPDNALNVGLWAKADPPVPNMFIWIVLQDFMGKNHTITLGPVNGPNWHYQSAEIPDRITQPATLSSILIFEPNTGDTGTPTSISLDDLEIIRASETQKLEHHVIVPFESSDGWVALPTSEGQDTDFKLSPEPVHTGAHIGNTVGVIEVGRGTDSGIRGIYRSVIGKTIPVVASQTFLESTQLAIGESFIARTFGDFTPFTVVNSVRYFPPLNPEFGGFIVANYDAIDRYARFRGHSIATKEHDIYLSVDENYMEGSKIELRNIVGNIATISDRVTLATDSVVLAGWRIAAIIAMLCAIAITILGYGTYLITRLGHDRANTTFLRALGMSKSAYVRMIAVEHISIALCGLVIGSLTGLAMSRMVARSFAHTETGNQLLPPFEIVVQWLPASLVYASVVIVGVVAGTRMVRIFSNTAPDRKTNIRG